MKIQGKSDVVINFYKQNSNPVNNNDLKIKNKDRIELSITGKEISKYMDEYNNIDLTTEKVDQIKKSIEKETYKVDEEKLAQSILDIIKREK